MDNVLKPAYIEICDVCNLNCPHCYNASSVKNSNFMSYDNFIHLMNGLIESGVTSIAISGGEPLLHPDISKILYCLKYQDAIKAVTIITNGVFILEKLDDSILNDSKFILQISLDGATEAINDAIRGNGHMRQVLKTLNELKSKSSIEVILKMTISALNQGDVDSFIDLNEKYCTTPAFAFISGLGRAGVNWGKKELSAVQKQQIRMKVKKRIGGKYPELTIFFPGKDCPISKKEMLNLLIKPNGDVHPCQMLYGSLFCLGNIFEESFKHIESYDDNKRLNNIFNLVNLRKELRRQNMECKDCLVSALCEEGCPAIALNDGGDFFGSDGNCKVRQFSAMKRRL